MDRQIIEQIRDHHLEHIAWVAKRGLKHIDLAEHRRWIDELNLILASEWFTQDDLVNAMSIVVDARKPLGATKHPDIRAEELAVS